MGFSQPLFPEETWLAKYDRIYPDPCRGTHSSGAGEIDEPGKCEQREDLINFWRQYEQV
jgi:hypothetical protein